MTDPTKRFSNRVENYLRYRPRYPRQILGTVQADCGLTPDSIIADVGCGTGFLADLFLANGNRVFGIEPNLEMREAAEVRLAALSNFTSVAATAEATSLRDGSVDFVVAGQAFHWFDRARCRAEFERVLRPAGWVVLVWNERRTETTSFLADYERLLHKYGTDYAKVDHRRMDCAVMRQFFGAEPKRKTFPHRQQFDFPALQGRLLSSSYVPEAGQPRFEEMLASLRDLFVEHQRDGQVAFEYDAVMYYGRLSSASE